MKPGQRNAFTTIKGILSQWGLQSLAKHVLTWVQQGYDQQSIQYMLTTTDAYKHRFAGNGARVKNGLSVLSPAEYLATEAAYRQIIRSAGLPKGFYDQHSDFVKMIGSDIAPTELQSRVSQANNFVKSTDPNLRAALLQYHGIGAGGIVAYYLDPKRATTLLQKYSDEAQVGQAALDQGLHLTSLTRVDKFLDEGFSAQQAQSAFQNVGAVLPGTGHLADIYGGGYSQSDAEDEFLGGMASAKRKRLSLVQQEQDTFSGSGGIGRDSFKQESNGY